MRRNFSGSSTFETAESHGQRVGFWKTNPTDESKAAREATVDIEFGASWFGVVGDVLFCLLDLIVFVEPRSELAISIAPPDGGFNPAINRSSVDFPQPEAPTNEVKPPGADSKLTFSNTDSA